MPKKVYEPARSSPTLLACRLGAKGGVMTINNGPPPADALGTARYIASITEELARLAKSQNLEALAYILEMAQLEANQISKQVNYGVARAD
jgi:hypothetical protein